MENDEITLSENLEHELTNEIVEVEPSNTLWTTVGRVADFAGISSFLISIITVILAAQIKLKIRKQVAKNDYIADVDKHINDLSAYCANLTKDKECVDKEFFLKIENTLDELILYYDAILSKSVIKNIQDTREYIEKTFIHHSLDNIRNGELYTCNRKLNIIKTLLAREKKEL